MTKAKPMPARTLKALKASGANWKRRADGEQVLPEGPDGCPLCDLFYDKSCKGCPVATATGRSECAGTPYGGWAALLDAHYHDHYDVKDSADDMRIFLESLLPKGEKA